MENFSDQNMRQRIFSLTLALYRVTDLFPKEEVLKRQMREKANDILSCFFERDSAFDQRKSSRVEILHTLVRSLKGYFHLADALKFVDPRNLAVLEREYGRIVQLFPSQRDFFSSRDAGEDSASDFSSASRGGQENPRVSLTRRSRVSIGARPQKSARNSRVPVSAEALTERQKKMTEHLRTAPRASISDFTKMFPRVSVKTIQRDIQALIQKNVFERTGEKRWTVYSLKRNVL